MSESYDDWYARQEQAFQYAEAADRAYMDAVDHALIAMSLCINRSMFYRFQGSQETKEKMVKRLDELIAHYARWWTEHMRNGQSPIVHDAQSEDS